MSKSTYNLPGGEKTTTSLKVYLREWNKIIRPLERLTGFKVTGCNPGLNLCKMNPLPNGKTAYDYSFQMPVAFAKAILEGAKRVALVVALAVFLTGCATCQFKPKLVEPAPNRPAQVQLWTW